MTIASPFGRCLRVLAASLTAAAVTLSAGCTTATPTPRVAPPAGKAWSLRFAVEFDGKNVDTTKLTTCFDWNTGDCTSSFNAGREHYAPGQVQLGNGIARLVAEPLAPARADVACVNGVCDYKSGLLATSRPDPSSPYLYSFTYGYVEARLKPAATPGMFTAFWMVPARPDYQYDYEIDVLEYLGGKPETVYQTYHFNDRRDRYAVNDISPDSNGNCSKVDYSSDFHTYGADWEPDHVAFFVDGTECGRFTATDSGQIANQPMQIVLDLMVDTVWNRNVDLVLPSHDATDHLDVDYLRVWQAQ